MCISLEKVLKEVAQNGTIVFIVTKEDQSSIES